MNRTWNGLLLVGAVVSLALAFLMASGCGVSQEVQVIREGRALLNRPAPGDPAWDSRRVIFLKDSEPYAAPAGTAIPAPGGK